MTDPHPWGLVRLAALSAWACPLNPNDAAPANDKDPNERERERSSFGAGAGGLIRLRNSYRVVTKGPQIGQVREMVWLG